MSVLIDITGQRFGRLTVVARQGSDARKYAMWLCRCDCGKELCVMGSYLRNGDTKGCGAHTGITHGMSRTAEYTAYSAARERCTNSQCKDYGGRGIQFRFTSFQQWFAELGPRPAGTDAKGKALYSVDRKDNDGHYAPGNVRWVTAKEQRANQRPRKKHHLRAPELYPALDNARV